VLITPKTGSGRHLRNPVAASPAALTKLAPHRRPAAESLGRAAGRGMRLAVKLATGGDVSVDVTAVEFGQYFALNNSLRRLKILLPDARWWP